MTPVDLTRRVILAADILTRHVSEGQHSSLAHAVAMISD